jgi:hypothetical protein
MEFVLVNGRIPRPQSFCVLCCEPIGESYLREIGTRLCYCNHDCYLDWLAESARIVLASSGASTPGLDGMDKRRLAAHLEHHLERLRVALLDGSYRPTPC